MMWVAAGVACGAGYAACAALAYAWTLAYFQREFPRYMQQRGDIMFAFFMASFGPAGLLLSLCMSSPRRRGWFWWPRNGTQWIPLRPGEPPPVLPRMTFWRGFALVYVAFAASSWGWWGFIVGWGRLFWVTPALYTLIAAFEVWVNFRGWRDADRKAEAHLHRAGAAGGAGLSAAGGAPRAGTSTHWGAYARAITIPPGADPAAEPVAPHVGARDVVLRGWRAYTLDYDEHGAIFLRGVRGVRWEGAALTAQCGGRCPCPDCARFRAGAGIPASAATAQHHLRAGECGCGIYAMAASYIDPSMAAAYYSNSLVLAECVLWGEVVEACPHGVVCTAEWCVQGYRAEHARIERVILLDGMVWPARQIEDRYRVPVAFASERFPGMPAPTFPPGPYFR